MEMGRILEAAQARGGIDRLRQQNRFNWYFESKPTDPWDQFYIAAFWDLNTERSYVMGPGPIPHHQIRDYADDRDLPTDLRDVFVHVIRQMDNAYLKQENERIKAESKSK